MMSTIDLGPSRTPPAVSVRHDLLPEHEADPFTDAQETVRSFGERALRIIQATQGATYVDRQNSRVHGLSNTLPVGPIDSPSHYLSFGVYGKRRGLVDRIKKHGRELDDDQVLDAVKVVITPFGKTLGDSETSTNSTARRPSDPKMFLNSLPSDHALSTTPDLKDLPDTDETADKVKRHIDLTLRFAEGVLALRPVDETFVVPSIDDILAINSTRTDTAPKKSTDFQQHGSFVVQGMDRDTARRYIPNLDISRKEMSAGSRLINLP